MYEADLCTCGCHDKWSSTAHINSCCYKCPLCKERIATAHVDRHNASHADLAALGHSVPVTGVLVTADEGLAVLIGIKERAASALKVWQKYMNDAQYGSSEWYHARIVVDTLMDILGGKT